MTTTGITSTPADATTVPRLVTVWFPDWPAHALVVSGEAAPDAAVAVVADHRVVARSAAAARAGVHHGLRRRDAQAACPSLAVVPADASRDARAFEPVLRAFADLVPTLEVVEPGQVAFPTRGPSRRLGGDAALADEIERLLTAAGARTVPTGWGIGIADGRFTAAVAARRAARQGAAVVVDPGASADFLAPLPTRALADPGGLPDDLVGLLGRLGLRRLGDVARVPAPDLLARFGVPGRIASLLAAGADETPPRTAPAPPDVTVDIALDEPLGQTHAVVFLARSASESLAADLARRGLVCTRLVVEIHTDGGHRSSRAWYRAGGLSAAAMVERVRWQVDGLVVSLSPSSADGGADGRVESGVDGAGSTGVVRLRLVPDELRADDGHQIGFWGGESEADEIARRAAARLGALLGADAVTVPEWRGGRDHPLVLVPAGSVDWTERAARVSPPAQGGPWPGRLPAPSPARRHDPPVPIEVLDDTGRRLTVSGRGLLSGHPVHVAWSDGRRVGVLAWAGPWPVEERWWDVRARRAARLQLLVSDPGQHHGQHDGQHDGQHHGQHDGRHHGHAVDRAHLVEVRDGRWWLMADYA